MEHQNESEIFNSFFNLDYEEQSGTGNAAVSPNLFTLGEHAPFPPVNDPIPWSEPMDSRLGYGRPPGNPSLGPTPIDETLAADISKEWSKRAFKCVVWEVENAEGLPHTCTGPCEKSMSDLLRHLRRKHFYVESCPCCHQHIYNEEEFETKHGKRGRNWCTVTQKQRRGKALDDTYESLYEAARSMDPQLRNLPANQRARNEGLSSTASSTIPVVGRSTPQPIFRSEFQPSSGCYRWTGSEYSWVAGGVNISKDGTGSSHHLSPPGILLQPAPAPDPVATYPSPFWSPYQPSSISSHYTSAERQRPEPGEEQN